MAEKRAKTISAATTITTILDLPPELLLQILSRLDNKDLNQASLVSKSFLALSDTFVRKLTFSRPLPPASLFRRVFSRFPSVTKLEFELCDMDHALVSISESQLELQKLEFSNCLGYPSQHAILKLSESKTSLFRNLTSLKLHWVSKLSLESDDDEVVPFVQLDDVINNIAVKVPNLLKVSLGSRHVSLSDHALEVLSLKCVHLQQVNLDCCSSESVTPRGVCALLQNCSKLWSLKLPDFSLLCTEAEFRELAKNIAMAKSLSHLTMVGCLVCDDVLQTVAKTESPLSLTNLTIKRYFNEGGAYTMTGLAAFLRACPGLTKLKVTHPHVRRDTDDMEMSRVVKSLPCLTCIWIELCYGFRATVASLVDNCPLLESMVIYGFEREGASHLDVPLPSCMNHSIKCIHLPDLLFCETIKPFCPNLKL